MVPATLNHFRVKFSQSAQLGIIIAMLLSPYVVLSLWGADAQLINFFPDDAFYYIKTARNLVSVGFATFDGINPTNGFHPLYFLLVSGLAGLTSDAWLLKMVFLLHVVMMWLAIFLLMEGVREWSMRWRVIFATILASPVVFLFVWASAGMEAPLVVLASVLLLNAWLQAAQFDFKNYRVNVWLGTCIAVFMLSRLDLVLTLIPFVLWFLVTQIRSGCAPLISLSSVLVPPLVVGVTYIAFNISTTDHILPISAAVKQIFFIPFGVSWRASTGNGSVILMCLALAPLAISLIVLGWAAQMQNTSSKNHGRSILVLSAISIIIYYVYLVFDASNFFRWYFSMPLATGVWVAVHWLAELKIKRLSAPKISIVMCAGIVLVAFLSNTFFVRYVSFTAKATSWHLMQIAQKLKEVTQPCEIVATYDAGVVGYFSNRRVINLDGLANSYAYLNDYLIQGKLLEYLEKEHVGVYLLRDQHAINSAEVDSGNYELVQFMPDKRVKLAHLDELFRYTIPESFTVIAYRYNNGRYSDCMTAQN